MNVCVGVSGGVDSAVALALLKNEGYAVVAVSMAVGSLKEEGAVSRGNGCYGGDIRENLEEARRVAEALNVPFRAFDCAAAFKRNVLDYFKNEYCEGRTPNPCVQCNERVKFGVFAETAKKEFGFDMFATGHYARKGYDEATGRHFLLRAEDVRKDQSYFLYRLSQEQIEKTLFPLGAMSKFRAREIAQELNLPVKDRKESQDFYAGDYKDLLEIDDCEGDIVLATGETIGKHRGIWNYTIGQRKGLGVARSEPLYVTGFDTKKNIVIAGGINETFKKTFIVRDIVWQRITNVGSPLSCAVKIRSANMARAAVVYPGKNEREARIAFNESEKAITPGQSAVAYDEEGAVLFGGVIGEYGIA